MKVLRRRRAPDEQKVPGVPHQPRVTMQKTGLRRRLLTYKDKVVDSLSAESLREASRAFERKLKLTRTGQLAVLAAIVPWAIAFVVAGRALYVFAYGAMALIAGSYLLAPRNLKLEGDRVGLLPRTHEGDNLDVHLELRAQKSVSTFILEERVPERLGKTVKVPITRLSKGSTLEHRYGLRCGRRGVYDIGPLVAVTSDPLGLTKRETVVAEHFEMLVHPRIEFVSDRPLTRRDEDPPIRPPVSRPWPQGMEFYGLREYKRGDEVRNIVWRASARMGKIMVREAEEGITDHITIILDTDRGDHSNDGDHSDSFEMAVRAAASLAIRHLREGYEIRVETNTGPMTRNIRGIQQQLPLLDSFARVEMSREPLTKVITRLIADPRRDAHNILITPRLTRPEAAQLKLMMNKGVSLMVVALIWDEANAATLSAASSLGAQVCAVRPDSDLATALYNQMGARR